MSTKVLVIIDPQNCFTAQPDMPLPVEGAVSDLERLIELIVEMGDDLDAIVVTLDTHPYDHISHANRWVDADGNNPTDFTIISYQDFLDGVWKAANPDDQEWQGEYLRQLPEHRVHTIWPVHGQEGTFEHEVYGPLAHALRAWEVVTGRKVTYVKKGMNRDTEQFGVFAADVPVPGAPETGVNYDLINEIASYDESFWGGEASSHCAMDSAEQFMTHNTDAVVQRMTVLSDCMSPVAQPPGGPNFPLEAEEWLQELPKRGPTVTTSTALLIQ